MSKRHHSHVGDLQSVFVRLEELVLANSGQDEYKSTSLTIAKIYDERFARSAIQT